MTENGKKKLTIIIPHYNSLVGLEALLNTIPKKENYQVIVIDDHSSCEFGTLSQKFNYVEFVSQSEGKKWAGAARNKGLSLADGEFVLFADSDDYFVEGAFDVVESYFDENCDVVYFSPTSVYDSGEPSLRHTKYSELVMSYLDNRDDTIRYEFFVPWSKLYKSEFLRNNNIKFDEVIASNDVIFSLLSGFYGENFEVSQETIYCVVESSNSLTTKISEDVVDSRFDVLCRYNEFVKEKLSSNRQVSVISCINRAGKIGIIKMLSVLFYSLYKGYPIFPNRSGIKRWLQRRMS